MPGFFENLKRSIPAFLIRFFQLKYQELVFKIGTRKLIPA